MICRRCLLRTSRTSRIPPPPRRYLTQSSSVESPATSPEPSNATKPFTTPISISPIGHGLKPNSDKTESPLVLSSVSAGTPLKGLNYVKSKTDPVAMEDSEYPPWLWDILKPKAKAEDENLAADLYCKFTFTYGHRWQGTRVPVRLFLQYHLPVQTHLIPKAFTNASFSRQQNQNQNVPLQRRPSKPER